ncbi:MAG TPA: hypothetical protein VD929_04515 [Caulobacteraceae bacterium]|nr:hypothetical protein [Caulobacteraceae bacterium]
MWRQSVLIAAAVLSACSTRPVQSTQATPKASYGAQRMTYYNLPKAFMEAELMVWGTSRYAVRLYEPVLYPDPDHRYFLTLNRSTFANESFRVEVDPRTGLLRSLNVVTDDQTTNVLAQIGAAVGGISSLKHNPNAPGAVRDFGDEPQGYCPEEAIDDWEAPSAVRSVQFDPLNPASVAAANRVLRDAMTASVDPGCYRASPGDAFIVVEALGAERLKPPPAPPQPADPADRGRPSAEVLCSRAICVPAMTSVKVAVRAPAGARPGLSAAEAIVSLPDSSTLGAVDIARARFVRTETRATFSGGMVREVSVYKPSEALAVASLPITVIRSTFGAMSEVLQLRINLGAKQEQLKRYEDADERSVEGRSYEAEGVDVASDTGEGFAAGSSILSAARRPKPFLGASGPGVPATAVIPDEDDGGGQ